MRLEGAPFVSAENFDRAFDVLDKARVTEQVYGMDRPFYAPGGYYGACWWSLDYALACEGVKWIRFSDAADMIHNLRLTQQPDGRVKLYGPDDFSHFPNVKEPIASLPRYFETARAVAVMSGDCELAREALSLISDSLRWWEKNRLDERTGLFSAVFEETFIPNTVSGSGVYAPVDTNMALALGYDSAAALSALLDDRIREAQWREKAASVRAAVSTYLWDEEKGAYFPYVLTQSRRYPALMGSTFAAFDAGDRMRGDRLEALMRDDARFGWKRTPLTSVAMDDPLFTLSHGHYEGNKSWSGSVWTLINDQAVRALRRAGRREAAGQLALKTVEAFGGNYAEFLDPFTNSGEGVKDYAWSAAQCVRLVVEELFGLSFDGFTCTLRADPLPCDTLRGVTMTLSDVALPDGRYVTATRTGNHVTLLT